MDLKKSAIAMDDRFVLKKRLEAQDMNLEPIPDWGLESIRGGFVEDVLTQEQIAGLISSSESIWPEGASEDQKRVFLDEIDGFLFDRNETKEHFQTGLTPAQQKERLLDAVKLIKETKKNLEGIRDMPLIHAEMAFLWARNSDNAAFKLRLKDDYGGFVSSMFARTWLHLDDVQSTLQYAAKRITISKKNKPSTYFNEGFLKRSAKSWHLIFGKWPPHSKEGCFFRFFQALGLEMNEQFTAHEVSKAVREAKEGK